MGNVMQISEFGKILIFLIVGIVMVAAALLASRLIAPNKPNPEKLTSYECGEEPTGSAWLPFNARFYVIALVFLLFDVEMVFIFPWAIVYSNKVIMQADPRWATLSIIEMFIFIGILILGLAYVWVKGDLDWIKAKPLIPVVDVKIPASVYDLLNKQQGDFVVRPFSPEPIPAELISASDTTTATTSALIRKPMFKPTFKKTEE